MQLCLCLRTYPRKPVGKAAGSADVTPGMGCRARGWCTGTAGGGPKGPGPLRVGLGLLSASANAAVRVDSADPASEAASSSPVTAAAPSPIALAVASAVVEVVSGPVSATVSSRTESCRGWVHDGRAQE